MNGATCSVLDDYAPRRKPQLPALRRTLPRWARRLLVLVIVLAAVVGLALVVLGAAGEYLAVRTERDALLADIGAAADPGVPSVGNRLVWGPPMVVVIRGEQWTVRSVLEKVPARVATNNKGGN